MAKNSQGVAALFNVNGDNYPISELVSVSIDGVQSDTVEVTSRLSTSREKQFRPSDVDSGTVSVTFRSAAMSATLVGQVGVLAVYGVSDSASYWLGDAMLQSLAWQASVGELQEYRATFKLGVATI